MKLFVDLHQFSDSLGSFVGEVKQWLSFLRYYSQKRLSYLAKYFEKIKDLLVSFLTVKRGRYSKQFLNVSFFFLVAGAVVVGPSIAEYYPSVRTTTADEYDSSVIVLSYLSQENFSTTTLKSEKPRFEILDYEVVQGDTLGTIAEKFGISIDTVKWANNLSKDSIKPGQILKIPPVTGIAHKVTTGDTIYSLAKKYQSEAQKIVNFPANDFTDLDTFALNVGQILFIPDGVPPSKAPVYKPQSVPSYIAGPGGRFMWPAQGSITQYPVSYHMAVDIANRGAPPIGAGDAGTVVYAGCLRYGYGCHVIINHGDGYQTLYAHLSSINVSVGANVSRGQVIGRMGSTGRSTGTHLHFEVRRNGVLLNPLPFLK